MLYHTPAARLEKQSMKMHFKKKYQILKIKVCFQNIPVIKLLFHTKIYALQRRGCCTFGMLEIRTLTPNRFKNQSSDTLNILDRNCNHI